MQKTAIMTILLCILCISSFTQASEWTGTWSCSVYADGQLDASLENTTLRQVVRVSIPGTQIRLTFSNVFGASPLVMQKVHLADSAGGHSIDPSTDTAVTFNGSESVTIPAGGTVTSDVLSYPFPALTNMAVTIYFGDVPDTLSGHVGSRTTSYYQAGDAVTVSSLTSPASSVRWYVIAGIDVYREDDARAVAAFGDSITDGYGTTTDAQNRWTDHLATRLQGVPETHDVGVLNAGIGATLVTGSGLNRLQRDVLDQTDVSYLIVLYGVNDILFGNLSSSQITDAYRAIITAAHQEDILVYGGTIMPFGGSSYSTAAREAVRQQVNTWIRNTHAAAGGFDAVIDFDAALRDPSDATRLAGAYDLDGLHPNPAGYAAMAEAIDPALFSLDETPPAVPTGVAATPQSYKAIDLDWDDNVDADLSHYHVWRATTSGGPYAQIATVTASSYNDMNPEDRLSAATPYYYVVSSVDRSGNESAQSEQSLAETHALPDDADPPTPNPATWDTAPYATGDTAITMTADPGSDLYGPVQYYFEETSGHPGGTDSGWQLNNSYTNTGLSPDTEYTYRVRLRDDLGNTGDYSTSQSATTFEGPGQFLESGGVLSIEAENGTLGSRWVSGTDAGASNDQYIEIHPDYNYTGTGTPECMTPECIAAYDFDISTAANYRFWFRIYSGNADDDSFFWRIDNSSWNWENNRFGTGLWFSTDNPQVDGLSAGSHTLQIGYRENGTRLDKFVIQLDSQAEPTGDGPPQSAHTQGPVDLPPSAPGGLSAGLSGNQINLTWLLVTGATAYTVKRAAISGGPYTVIASNISTNSYSDSSVAAGITYYYVVSAENEYGESPNSHEASQTLGIINTAILQVDFGTTGSPLQNGYAAYTAGHEQPETFTTRTYPVLGTAVSITPTWADGAEAAVMQMYDRGPGAFEDAAEALVQDWIGSDTRSTGDPLTLRISGLPPGRYHWLSYHTDTGTSAPVGTFDVTVHDGAGSATTTDIQCTNDSAAALDEVATFETTITSDGVDDITLVFDTQPYSNVYNQAWFVMNGFEVSLIVVSDPNLPVLREPSHTQENVSVRPTLKWVCPQAYTPDAYELYLGTNPAVTENPVYTVWTEAFTPGSPLHPGTTYYWTVVAYDGPVPYAAEETWSFTTLKPRDRVAGNMMLINDNAGWCWYQDDKIIYDPVGGNILTSTAAQGLGFGGVGGSRLNDMDATTFNIATGRRTRVVAREGDGGDDHNMGAFWIRPDGRYLHLYCMHYNNQDTFYRVSAFPYDGSAWGSEQTYNWEVISGLTDTMSSSYTNIHYVSGEGTGSGRLYNIMRVFERTPCISYSDDAGVTWQYMGRLNGVTGTTTYSNFYHKFRSNGVDRIDFIGCEQHPRNYTNSIYHGYIQNGISYDSYGNQIDIINDQDAPPIGAFTTVWATGSVAPDTYHTGWTNELELDENGYPVCLFQTRYGTDSFGGASGAADHRFFYGRFDGSAWTCTELAKMGPGMHSPEQDYIGMGCIHPNNTNIIYIATPFDPRDDTPLEHREIFKGETADKGLTWNWTQITVDSTEDNIRPAVPQWDANNTAVFWNRGIYPATEQYDFVLVGMVEEEGKTLSSITYIDATASNTTEADGSAFTPDGPSGSSGAADNQWHMYTGYGNDGGCYTAGETGTEDAPAIRTTVSDLADGIYDVFAYFWCDPLQDWGLRGGFSTSDLLCFSKQSSQHAEASQFSDPVDVMDDTFLLYRVYIGRRQVSGGSAITVYIDDYDGSYNVNAPARTTYDGIGIASVSANPAYHPGDLSRDGRVDLVDLGQLSHGWQTNHTISTLLDIAENWLYGL